MEEKEGRKEIIGFRFSSGLVVGLGVPMSGIWFLVLGFGSRVWLLVLGFGSWF